MDVPFKICKDDILGRHLVATRSIQSGEIIIKEPPLVRGPFLQSVPVCVGCGKIIAQYSSRPCTKCGWPVCGEACENSQLHIPECFFTVSKGSKISIQQYGIRNPNYQFITILRCLYLKEFSPEQWDKLMILDSHETGPKNFVTDFLPKFFKLEEKFTCEEVDKVLNILTVNGHEVPLFEPPFLALYETSSFLEHSCRANCCKTFTNDGEILIIASTSISEGDHLSICYTDPIWGAKNRRLHLYQTKQFWCNCPRCKDPTEMNTHINSLKCADRSCDGFALPSSFVEDSRDSWICNKCEEELPESTVNVVLDKIGNYLTEMTKGNPQVCKDFIKKFRGILSPNHYYMLDVKMALLQMLGLKNPQNLSDADVKLSLDLSEKLLEVVNKIAPAENRLRGLLLFQQMKALQETYQRQNEEGSLVMQKSKEILKECVRCLQNEPSKSQEAKIYRQAKILLQQISNVDSQYVDFCATSAPII